jgi:hypothetical protein
MPDSPHVKGKVVIPIKKTAEPVSPRGDALLPPLVVHFRQRMKRQCLYPLVVRWSRGDYGYVPVAGENAAVILRPIVPGALVVPSELLLNAVNPDASATFHVTPLARGSLAGARVEVLHQDRRVQSLPLPMRVYRLSPSAVLLALAFLIPLFLLLTAGPNKLTAPNKRRAPTEIEKKSFESRRDPTLVPGNPTSVVGKKGKAEDKKAPAEAKGGKGAGQNEVDLSPPMTVSYTPSPGEVLEDRLKAVLPSVPVFTAGLTGLVSSAYQLECDVMDKGPQFAVYGTFLVLVVASILLYTRGRATVRSQPVALR